MWKEKTSSLEALCRLRCMRDKIRSPLHMDQSMRWISKLQVVSQLFVSARPFNSIWFHSWRRNYVTSRWITKSFFQLLHWYKNRKYGWAINFGGAIVLNGDWTAFRRSDRTVSGCYIYAFFLFLLSRRFDKARPYNQWKSKDEPTAFFP